MAWAIAWTSAHADTAPLTAPGDTASPTYPESRYPTITALRNDMPREVVDPINGRRHPVWGEVWSMLKDNRCCVSMPA